MAVNEAQGSMEIIEDEYETVLDEIRMVLLGKIGGGKSALGNLLVSSQVFPEGFTQAAVTKEAFMKQRIFGQRTLKVVDTPGFFDPVIDPRDIKAEIKKSLRLVDPGPHAFLVVLKADRLTPEERACAQKITEIIGPEALNYCILIITHSDYFAAHGTTFEAYYNSGDRFLPDVLIKQNFGGRYMIVNSKEIDTEINRRFIVDLIKLITSMVGKNDGKYFENEYVMRVPRTELKRETMANIKIVEEARTISITAKFAVTNSEDNRVPIIEQTATAANIVDSRRRNSSGTGNQESSTGFTSVDTMNPATGTSRRGRKKKTCTVL